MLYMAHAWLLYNDLPCTSLENLITEAGNEALFISVTTTTTYLMRSCIYGLLHMQFRLLFLAFIYRIEIEKYLHNILGSIDYTV